MQLAMIGLGRMGANMTERLIGGGHQVVGYDLSADAIAAAVAVGATAADALEDLVSKLDAPRAVWIMVPHGDPVDQTIAGLDPHLAKGDIVVDGGNTFYKETVRRAAERSAAGHHLVDVGTSGGIWGLTEGYSMMVGGDPEPVERLRPVLETLAPSPTTGWGHVGPSGAGHFAKMIHNGIEYGIMQALAEGFAVMQAKDAFDLDLAAVGEIWRYGSVVRSWLLDLTCQALAENPDLADIAPYVPDSGEGRWAVAEAIDLDVAAPVMSLSLLQRIASRDPVSFGDRLVSAMRGQFGGHTVRREG
ncbi:MAG: decarboxylating 6-phosphogluconate dehydrogenase [Actinomycetota bacterium]|nr:decarboxylating 6-phosphogluconate dehydrogenase [Actinomycetota bacterium]